MNGGFFVGKSSNSELDGGFSSPIPGSSPDRTIKVGSFERLSRWEVFFRGSASSCQKWAIDLGKISSEKYNIYIYIHTYNDMLWMQGYSLYIVIFFNYQDFQLEP